MLHPLRYEWLHWVDLDTLFMNLKRHPNEFLDPAFDLHVAKVSPNPHSNPDPNPDPNPSPNPSSSPSPSPNPNQVTSLEPLRLFLLSSAFPKISSVAYSASAEASTLAE